VTGRIRAELVLIWVALGIVCAFGVFGAFVLFLPSLGPDDATHFAALTAAFLTLFGLAAARASRPGWLGRTLPVAAIVFMAIGMLGVTLFDYLSWTWEYFTFFMTLAIGCIWLGMTCLYAVLLTSLSADSALARITKWTGLLCAVAACVIVVGLRWTNLDLTPDSGLGRSLGIVLIIGIIATAATAALSALGGAASPESELGERPKATVICPRCGGELTATSGREEHCPSCRLRVTLEIEEPRCACGYLLLGLTAEVCPECGRAIDENDRWSGGGGKP